MTIATTPHRIDLALRRGRLAAEQGKSIDSNPYLERRAAWNETAAWTDAWKKYHQWKNIPLCSTPRGEQG